MPACAPYSYSDGRRCRLPRAATGEGYCHAHTAKLRKQRAEECVAGLLTEPIAHQALSSTSLTFMLARLFALVANGHVPPKTSNALLRIVDGLRKTLPNTTREFLNCYDTSGLRTLVESLSSMTMKTTFTERAFQPWEYRVSHGSLLIRSPKAPGVSENIDLVCVGVEYLAAPRHMKGLDLVEATPEEINNLSQLLGKELQPVRVRVIFSEGRRFPIVAASFRFAENEGDIFESPFDFHGRK